MMSYERLEQAISGLLLAEKTLKDNVSLFEQYITDKSIPLDRRWEFWTLAPVSIKGTSGWCSDGHLEAFNILGCNPRDAMGYDGKYIHAERYTTWTMTEVLDYIVESYFDYDGNRDFDKFPEDIDWDEFDWGASSWPEFPVFSEFVTAFKEEVLAKNIHSFRYDW